MDQPTPPDQPAKRIQLRRCILKNLYAMFQEYPYAAIELSYLNEMCPARVKELNWNLAYLEKKGLVELDKSSDCPPYISCTVTIGVNGIDLVENEGQFDQLYPDKT